MALVAPLGPLSARSTPSRRPARAGGVSVASAREMAGQFAATGRIGTEMYGGLIGTVKDYAATTGQDVPDATKALADAFADPARGADALDKQLAVLNDTTRENIQRLAAQGDRLGAQKALFDAYKSGLTSATELTSGWGHATAAAGATISNAFDRVGQAVDHFVTGGDLETKIADLRKVLATPPGFLESFSSTRPALQSELNKLLEQQRKQQADATTRQQNMRSVEVGNIIRGLNPASETIKDLQDKADNIARLFRENWIDPNGQAKAAIEGLRAQAKQLAEDMKAGGAEFAAATRQAQFGNRTAGFAPEALSVAQINQDAENRRIAARREQSQNPDLDAYANQLASIEKDRQLLLETAQRMAAITTSAGSGRYSTGIGQVPEQYRALIYSSATAQGLSPDLIASQIRRESSFNPSAVSPAGAQGISQFMPATARGMGLNNPFDPSQAIPKQAELMAQLMRQFNNNEVAALIGYNAGPRVAQRFVDRGSDVSTLPRETQEYIKAILTPPPNAQAMVTAETERTRQLELQRQTLSITDAHYGRNSIQYEAQAAAAQRLSDELGKGVSVTDSYRASITANALATATAAQNLKLVQFNSDAAFARDQLGRTTSEQAAYSQARSLVGLDSQAAPMVIQQQMLNDNLKQTKDLANSAFSGMLGDLKQGVSLATVFSNLTGRIADKLLSTAADKVISGLFSGANTSGGGILGSLAGLIGGGAIPRFDSGGYTGHGGRYQPAGIVHAGEVVWSQADVARYGGASVVDRMRRGMPGYADGACPCRT
ncbi:hypothetical protein CTI14_00280 [Methylobacterium radiotolerans]|nr:hypothetical protein CTI14_00280 [Methylobacterium radiotolerans]